MSSVSGVVLLNDEYPVPVSGLTVFALDEQGQTISSTTQTDASGQFTLYFWPESAGSAITVRVRRTAISGPYPDLRLSYTLAQPGDINPGIALTMGTLGTLERHTGRVLGTEPIAGATLRFLALIGNGRYRVDVRTTNLDGEFDVSLYPGEYEVDVIPPMDSRYRISRVRLEVGPGQALELRPQRRILVSGTVVDTAGTGVDGARIYAELKTPFFAGPDLNRPNEIVVARGQHVQTGGGGNFVLQLDPGEHRLRVNPPRQSGLAPLTLPLNVPALDTTIIGLQVNLPAAAALQLKVINADSADIARVRVEAYRTDTSPPAWLGQAWSDEGGEVLLRIPNSE